MSPDKNTDIQDATTYVFKWSIQTILFKLCLWLLSKPWFRMFLIKLVTSAVESTKTKVDDQIVEFIKEHRRSLVTIANKEVKKDTSPVDARLLEAIKSVKIK